MCAAAVQNIAFLFGRFHQPTNKQAAAARIKLRDAAKARAHIPGPLNAYIFQSLVLEGIHTTCGTTCSGKQPARKHAGVQEFQIATVKKETLAGTHEGHKVRRPPTETQEASRRQHPSYSASAGCHGLTRLPCLTATRAASPSSPQQQAFDPRSLGCLGRHSCR